MDDVLAPLPASSTNSLAADVINFIKAAGFAVRRLKELPPGSRLLKQAHAVLMEDGSRKEKVQEMPLVKGQGKEQEQSPGEIPAFPELDWRPGLYTA